MRTAVTGSLLPMVSNTTPDGPATAHLLSVDPGRVVKRAGRRHALSGVWSSVGAGGLCRAREVLPFRSALRRLPIRGGQSRAAPSLTTTAVGRAGRASARSCRLTHTEFEAANAGGSPSSRSPQRSVSPPGPDGVTLRGLGRVARAVSGVGAMGVASTRQGCFGWTSTEPMAVSVQPSRAGRTQLQPQPQPEPRPLAISKGRLDVATLLTGSMTW